MKFEVSDPIPFSVDDAFILIRDDMPSLVPYMKDTESIEVIERRDEGDQTFIVNRWRASPDRIPKILRSVIKPDLLTWLDHATWSTEAKEAQWKLEAIGSDKLFSCSGISAIRPHGDQAKLVIQVDLEIYPERVPGVPRLLAKKIGGQIEKFLGDMLSENMRQLAKSMSDFKRGQR